MPSIFNAVDRLYWDVARKLPTFGITSQLLASLLLVSPTRVFPPHGDGQLWVAGNARVKKNEVAMAHNYLEQLVAEWYEYQGYFVRRNILVGKRDKGGHECELDVVAFNPETQHLVHVEPSMDANKWAVREARYAKKFEAGRKHIPTLFKGLASTSKIEQIALLGFASNKNVSTVGGGRVMLIRELLAEIFQKLQSTSLATSAVSEQFGLLRTLQIVSDNRKFLREYL